MESDATLVVVIAILAVTIFVCVTIIIPHYDAQKYSQFKTPNDGFCNSGHLGCYDHYKLDYYSHGAIWTNESSQLIYNNCKYLFCGLP
jgi:hypothetical protein